MCAATARSPSTPAASEVPGARGRCPRARLIYRRRDPMKKLALEIADLRVDSFATVAEEDARRGTVAAAEATVRCTARDCTCTCGGADPGVAVDVAPTCFCCA